MPSKYAETLEQEMERAERMKSCPVGRILYYIHKHGMKWDVQWGEVVSLWADGIILKKYEVVDTTIINAIPKAEFKTPSPYHKIPKNWFPSTDLIKKQYSVRHKPLEKAFPEAIGLSVRKPEDVKKLIEIGLLIPVSDYDYGILETDFDRSLGWRVIRTYKRDEYHPETLTLKYTDVYYTYEEAEAEIKAYKQEIKRQSELSDLEWSIEQIDNALNKVPNLTDEKRAEYRKWILSQKDVEDIAVRYTSFGGIQWKYDKLKTWHTIEL